MHGLNGRPLDSWTSSNGVLWPRDLLPQFLEQERVRILTYGYNADVVSFTDGVSSERIHNHAEDLVSALAANRNLNRCLERPVIFVCHSLGGIVVKRALIYAHNVSSERTEHLRSIFVSTFAVLFLGTPHNGADIAKWGLMLQKMCDALMPKKLLDSSSHLVGALRSNHETLQNINSLFVEIMGRFRIYFFHETRATNVLGRREIIVDESSAAPYFEGVERMGIDADHSHMCKFADPSAPGFEVLVEALLRYAQEAPFTIARRWTEEKALRARKRKEKAREIFSTGVDSAARAGKFSCTLHVLPLASVVSSNARPRC